MNKEITKFFPLTESTAYILLVLAEPMHGYAVMKKVEEISENTVRIGPGTLYGTFSGLESSELIEKVGEDGRRKVYQLTGKGRQVLAEQHRRLNIYIKQTAAVVGS